MFGVPVTFSQSDVAGCWQDEHQWNSTDNTLIIVRDKNGIVFVLNGLDYTLFNIYLKLTDQNCEWIYSILFTDWSLARLDPLSARGTNCDQSWNSGILLVALCQGIFILWDENKSSWSQHMFSILIKNPNFIDNSNFHSLYCIFMRYFLFMSNLNVVILRLSIKQKLTVLSFWSRHMNILNRPINSCNFQLQCDTCIFLVSCKLSKV